MKIIYILVSIIFCAISSYSKDCAEPSTIDLIYQTKCNNSFCYRSDLNCRNADEIIYSCDNFKICLNKSDKKVSSTFNYNQECTKGVPSAVRECQKTASQSEYCINDKNECPYGEAEITYACKKFVICKYKEAEKMRKNFLKGTIAN